MQTPGAGGTDIHARSFADRFQPFQYLNIIFIIFLRLVVLFQVFSLQTGFLFDQNAVMFQSSRISGQLLQVRKPRHKSGTLFQRGRGNLRNVNRYFFVVFADDK